MIDFLAFYFKELKKRPGITDHIWTRTVMYNDVFHRKVLRMFWIPEKHDGTWYWFSPRWVQQETYVDYQSENNYLIVTPKWRTITVLNPKPI